ncbi:iron ABC transporter permease [Paenibacillus filicis]|uniref:Iron ABC transporter permease n=1 Tax=Paenibacillus filicis TaxID=669464 RepID=A0ABU9DGK2_9BACL
MSRLSQERSAAATRIAAEGRFPLIVLGLAVLLLVSVTLAVMLGPVRIEPSTVWKIAFSHIPGVDQWLEPQWSKAQGNIIWDIRFPRVLLGAVVGGGLAVVGTVIQALTRNPLSDPYILGVSSGASAAATLVILFGAFQVFGSYALSVSAFLGSLLAIVLVYMLARVGGSLSNTRLLLAGIAVSMMLSALTSFIVTMAPKEEGIRSAMFWMMGSLTGAKWSYLSLPSFLVVAGTAYLMLQYRSLNALLMGEETAVTLGVHMDRFRKVLVIVASLLTGVIVAVSGAIGFIGLMIPHLVRLLVGSDHRRVLPVSMLLGASFMIWADVFARLVLAPEELPVGIVTALCGGPFFIWLLRRSSYSF